MRVHPIIFGTLVIVIFLGVILGFQSAGIWSVSGKVTVDGKAIQPSSADPNTLKGWMTLDQVVTTYNVPLDELISQFNLPSDTPPTTAIKDLESDTFDTTLLKEWLLERVNVVSTQVVETAPPAKHTPEQTTTNQSTQEPQLIPAPTEHTAPANTVTGKTTIQNLLDWGIPKEKIQNILGGDLPAPSTIVKDYVTGKGLEFTSIKTQLQNEIDKK
jgi:hypothetical protein